MTTNRNLSIRSGNVVSLSGSLITLTGSVSGSQISGTIAQFTNISGTIISASQYIGPINATPGGNNTNIQFNKSGSFSGSNNLTYNFDTNVLSGTTAQFTTITGSTVTGSTALFTTITGSQISGSRITGSFSGSYVGNLTGTSSFASNSDLLDNLDSTAFARLSTVNNTFTNTNTFNTNYVTVSVGITGSDAKFATITGSTVTGSTALFTTITGSQISGSRITGSFSGSYTGNISGTLAQFTNITASVISASTYYGINLTSSTITGSELNIDYVDFVPQATEPTYQLGRVFYDGSGSLAAYTDITDVKINLGQQLMLRCHNETGVTLTRGKVVRITTTLNNTDTPRITTASWDDDASSATTLGVVVRDINNTQEGYVILNGILKNINTNALTVGQMLYLSSSGDMTTTIPVSPKHEVRVAQVVRAATNGTIFVRVQNGYEIDELHNVLITNIQNGDLLTYNSSSAVWENKKSLSGSYNITGSLSVTDTISSSVVTASNLFVSGDLSVNGTASIAQLNTINQTSLLVGDKYITILSGAVDHTGINGAGFLWGTSSGPGETTGTLGEHAHILYDASRDALEIFPGLYVTGSSTFFEVSGTVAQFTTITGSQISGSRITGSFSGSYAGNISGTLAQFTNISASAISASTYLGLPVTTVTAAGSTGQVQFNSGSNALTADSNFVWDNNNKRLSLGKSAANTTLDVLGNTFISGNLTVTGSVTELSTIKIKTNVVSLDSQLTTISKLNPVTYNRIDDGRKEYGFIAEELKQIYPEFVIGDGVNYPKMVSILVGAVKELTDKLNKQQEEIETLKNNKKHTRGKK